MSCTSHIQKGQREFLPTAAPSSQIRMSLLWAGWDAKIMTPAWRLLESVMGRNHCLKSSPLVKWVFNLIKPKGKYLGTTLCPKRLSSSSSCDYLSGKNMDKAILLKAWHLLHRHFLKITSWHLKQRYLPWHHKQATWLFPWNLKEKKNAGLVWSWFSFHVLG